MMRAAAPHLIHDLILSLYIVSDALAGMKKGKSMSPIENINTRTSDKKQQSPNDVENSKEKAAGDNSAAATSAKEVSEEARGDEGGKS